MDVEEDGRLRAIRSYTGNSEEVGRICVTRKKEEIAYAGNACLGDISERSDSPRCDFFLDFYDLLD